ncbi:HET-domain-containing protein [Apiospora marii]|uniref:HET-domain-containing protein n=1 Tax=Apiospora marii TaxID=335849 RepID=A0ABR1RZE5_9PEZI
MGNLISSTSHFRSCGLCYFKLPVGTPFLDQPSVSRRAIPVKPNSSQEAGRLDDVLLPPKNASVVEMKTELTAFTISSERSCVGCAAFLECLDRMLRDQGFMIDEQCWHSQCMLTWLVGDRKSCYPSFRIVLQVTKATANQEPRLQEKSFEMLLGYTGPTYSIPAARKALPSFALGYTGSTGSLNSIRAWLEDCELSHENCRPPADILPDRVVELSRDPGGQIIFRLVQGLGRRAAYACLSHRWGPSTERCKTTTATLAAHFEQVPSSILPKNFREASEVALYLGLKYLWIDSLCIIQDDAEDWKVQAAQMCNIYSGAYLTIAATSSGDSDNGMFRTVSTIPISPVETNRSDIFIREYPSHFPSPQWSPDPNELAKFPLLTRGWVYQERLLSPRVVHFTRCEVLLECSARKAYCECGEAADVPTWARKHNYRNPWPEKVRSEWNELVGEYSALQLTYTSDKIPALAGIARYYGTRHRSSFGRYVAGLWENSLPQDLLWYVKNAEGVTRPEVSPEPSWSWASVTGRIDTWEISRTATTASEQIQVFHPSHNGSSIGTGGYDVHPDYMFSDAKGARRLEEGSQVFCLKTGFLLGGRHFCLILRSLDEERTVFERVGLLQRTLKEEVDSWYEDGQTAHTFRFV